MTAGGRIGDLAQRTIVPRMHLLAGPRERVIDSQKPAAASFGIGTPVVPAG